MGKIGFPSLRRGGDYRTLIALAVLIGLVLTFWLGSRYPALDEKAIMGGDTPLSGLSFEIVFDILPDSPRWWSFVANTGNWIATNVKGMTFGVLFGAVALTLLSLVKTRSFENGFANAALGAVIGAPLGVCVNCAAPIALGLHAGRMRLETTLSALIASPTLNIIVVTMSFTLLPLHIALTKLILTVLLVLLIVPLLCRYVLVEETQLTKDGVSNLAKVSETRGLTAWIGKSLGSDIHQQAPDGLVGSLIWFARNYLRNLFFIGLITVPMMFLAAMMGAVVAMDFDSASLVNALPRSGAIPVLLAMLAIAIVASFVPAPIALDVILTIVLMGIGLASFYSTAVLIALGSFSVYAFIILWRAVSLRTALSLWAATIALAMIGGVIAMKTQPLEMRLQAQRTTAFIESRAGFDMPALPALPKAADLEALSPGIGSQAIESTPLPIGYSTSEGSTITAKFAQLGSGNVTGRSEGGLPFDRVPGAQLGFDDIGTQTPLHEFAPSMMVGGIAAGDIHNDGWTDIVFRRPLGARGLSLYANIGGKYERQELDLGPVGELQIANTAFADLDNDGWLDLIVTSFWDGLYIFTNRSGQFDQDSMIHVPGPASTTTMAVSFSDIDGDGWLDILLGEWASRQGKEGWARLQPSTTANRIVWNDGDGNFRAESVAGSIGQTLTGLVTDVNRDGRPDYLKGDDFKATDQFVFFSPDGRTRSDKSLQPFPYFVQTSMSYDEGDWNNDLIPDYYGGQISEPHGSEQRTSVRGEGRILKVCQQFGRDFGWANDRVRQCAAEMLSVDQIRAFRTGFTYNLCQSEILSDRDATLCGIGHFLGSTKNSDFFEKGISGEGAFERCSSALKRWPFAGRYCETFKLPMVDAMSNEEIERLHKPAIRAGNILMTGGAAGSFTNMAPEQQVDFPGWTWNSRFTDLDQDGWQDLLVMTGAWFSVSRTTTNVFYRNEGGTFADRTEQFGFTDVTPSYSFAALDFDRDGDIDVIRPPDGKAVVVHRNEKPSGPALWVHLRDRIGNRMGIDARVTICVDGITQPQPGKCQTRPINAGGGFMSFDPIAAHFGLGNAKNVSLIQVVWRDGETTDIRPDSLLGGEVTISRQK
ncbi:hypothetical protein HKD42_10730 [Altererythrobacter sp. RZ02]|uniref:ASPIC/UnbV domain-containing protein n=1 Tax=Pontixanthobacter rizhaonensis TaxID=2730337 RepID=A0A848QSS3_9SPHN|nr:FG-GAP-like repeat-containing protein [Pontixanthobacter rizhaonensis]NMW32536.1 hypothetical protein [Pontixanthobacter rizhaonensis]